MAKLVLQGTDSAYPLGEKPLVIGRTSQCDIPIAEHRASRTHCEVGKDSEGYYVKDLASRNGTYVNTKKVQRFPLRSGDKISIGKTTFLVDLEDAPSLLCSSIAALKPCPSLLIKSPKQNPRHVLLQESKYALGRKEIVNDLCLVDNQVSSQHAEIAEKEDGWWITNTKSKNGVFVNTQQVESCRLKHGDIIRLGETTLLFQDPKKQKNCSERMFWPLFLLVLGSISLVFFGAKYFLRPTSKILITLPGNMIDDFSFESGFSWESSSQMRIAQTEYRSGKSSLYASSLQESAYEETKYVNPLDIAYGKAYTISFWTKYQDIQGVAGLKILWLSKKEKLFEEYSPFLRQSSLKWQNIVFTASPPPSATHFYLFCFTMGKVQAIHFDDIHVQEKDDSLTEGASLKHDGLILYADKRGILQAYHHLQHLFSLGRFHVWQGESENRKLIATQEFSQVKLQEEGNRLAVKGEMYHLQGGPSFSLALEGETKDDRLSLSCKLMNVPKRPDLFVEYTWPIALPEEREHKEKEEWFQSHPDHLLWQAGKKIQIGIFYPKPLECRMTKDSHSIRLCYPLLPNEKNEYVLDLTLKTNLHQDSSKIHEWKQIAEDAYNRGSFGKASQYYDRIHTNLIFHPFAQTAWQRLNLLRQLYQKDVEALSERLKQAQFFQQELVYERVIEEALLALKKWEGSPLPEMIALLKEAQAQKQKCKEAKAQKEYSQWLQRAESFRRNHYALFATLFYEEILERYPDKNKESQPSIQEKIQSLKKSYQK